MIEWLTACSESPAPPEAEITIGPYCVSNSGSLARTLRTGSTTGRFDAKTARSRVSPASACSTYTTSAWSTPRCGRPLNVSSIFTAMTAPAGGAPIPVNGLVGRTGLGLGLGLGFGLGVGVALDGGVGVGVGDAEAATGRDDVFCVAATPMPTPAATTTAALTPAMTFCFVLRARTRLSTITMLPPRAVQRIAAVALDPETPASRRCRSSAASHDALRGEESAASGGPG